MTAAFPFLFARARGAWFNTTQRCHCRHGLPMTKIARRSTSALLIVMLAALLCGVFPERTLGRLSAYLTVDQVPTPADAVIILQGGGPERVLKAAELFEKRLVPRVVFTSGFYRGRALEEAPPGFRWTTRGDVYTAALLSLNIPQSAITELPADQAFDTSHELELLAHYAAGAGWKKVILVTSDSHTRRAHIIWKRVSGAMQHSMTAAREGDFAHWWRSGETRRRLAYEYLSLIKESTSQITSRIR